VGLMSYVTIVGVRFVRVITPDKSFVIQYGGREYVIPEFAVSDASEIHVNTDYPEGDLILLERIAIEKGLVEDTGGTGVGIPLKRNRLPDPPELMSEERLSKIQARWEASSAHELGWEADGDTLAVRSEADPACCYYIAVFEGPFPERDVDFTAHAPDDINDLMNENRILRDWMAKAIEKSKARRKRS